MQTQHGVSRSLASKPKIVPTARKQVSDHGGISLGHAPPVVQGIPLVPVHRLPDRLRSLFPFELFNAVQSKVFETVYNSNDNIVLSSPTGSGKTIVLELAVCRAIETMRPGTYKVIYQAPTKALCAEKKRLEIVYSFNFTKSIYLLRATIAGIGIGNMPL